MSMNTHPSIISIEEPATWEREYLTIGQRLSRDDLKGARDDPYADFPRLIRCPEDWLREQQESE